MGVPTNWELYSGNPILVGSGDHPNIYAPSVLIENGIWKMWYGGWEAGYYPNDRIYRARSTDGLHWTKEGIVLDIGTGWESAHVNDPSVVKVGDTYYLYYTGALSAGQDQIGVATSSDGLSFTKYVGNPIIPRISGTWQDYVARPSVIYENGKFRMWYDARDVDGKVKNVGYAESSDGFNFTRRDEPVLSVEGSMVRLANPAVIKLPDGQYLMAIDGWTEEVELGHRDLYFAYSDDGIHWTWYPRHDSPSPVIRYGQVGFSDYALTTSCFVLNGSELWIFMGGSSVSTLDANKIGVAFSEITLPPSPAIPTNLMTSFLAGTITLAVIYDVVKEMYKRLKAR